MTDLIPRPGPRGRHLAAGIAAIALATSLSMSASRAVEAMPLVGDMRSSEPLSLPPPRKTLDAEPVPLRPFAMNLYERGDFVAQRRADWCVPASIQTMINMIESGRGRAVPTQARLDRMARRLSTWRLVGAGSEPEGWARTLDRLGYGPYAVRAERTRATAYATAARAIRRTGRPVGMLVWRGAHAWVVSGFRATADPKRTDDFRVTHLYVHDPLYPRGSSTWGPSRAPNARLRVGRVAEDFLSWRRPTVRYPAKDGRFVLVVPVDAPTPAT